MLMLLPLTWTLIPFEEQELAELSHPLRSLVCDERFLLELDPPPIRAVIPPSWKAYPPLLGLKPRPQEIGKADLTDTILPSCQK